MKLYTLKELLIRYERERIFSENIRITFLSNFLKSPVMEFYEENDEIYFADFEDYLAEQNENPNALFSRQYLNSYSRSAMIFRQFKSESACVTTDDINRFIRMLSLFLTHSPAQDAVMNIMESIAQIDYLTNAELSLLCSTLNEFAKHYGHIKEKAISIVSVIRKVQYFIARWLAEKDSPTAWLNQKCITIGKPISDGEKNKHLSLNNFLMMLKNDLVWNRDSNEDRLSISVRSMTIQQLHYFVNLMLRFPAKLAFEITFEFTLLRNSVNEISRLLTSHTLPDRVSINNLHCKDSESFQLLMLTLQSCCWPKNAWLDLVFENLTNIKDFAALLQSGKVASNVTFIMQNHNRIPISLNKEEIEIIMTALQSANAPQNLRLYFQVVNDEALKVMATAIQSGKLPKGLYLDILNIRNLDQNILVCAVNSGFAPIGFKLRVDISRIAAPPAEDLLLQNICALLKSGHGPDGLTLSIASLTFNQSAAFGLIFDAIRFGRAPKNLIFESSNNSSCIGIKNIADLLASDNCPLGFTLDLWVALMSKEIQSLLATTLLTNTSIMVNTHLFEHDHKGTTDDLEIIRYCSLRNKLMLDYPEYSHIIKKISHEHGLYIPSIKASRTFPSLRFLSLHAVQKSKQSQSVTLPQDLCEQMKILSAIQKRLSVTRQRRP